MSWYYLILAGYKEPWKPKNGKCFATCAGDDTAIFLATKEAAERVRDVMVKLSSKKKQIWEDKETGKAATHGLG